MSQALDPTFYRSPAAAVAAPPETLAYIAAFDPAVVVHVDLVADDFDADLERLRGLGATVLSTDKTPDGKPSAVLSDPQGNEFCLA